MSESENLKGYPNGRRGEAAVPEFNEGDKVRITFENGTITEGIVQREKFGARELFVDAHTRVYMTSLVVERSKVEVTEKAKPKLPTKIGTLIRCTPGESVFKRWSTGWYAHGLRERIDVRTIESWEEVEVVPKAALDTLRDVYARGVSRTSSIADFLGSVDK